MIKTVIFDIGMVLIKFNWDSYISKLFDEKTTNAVTRAMWTSGHWNELDRGVLSDEEVLQLFIKEAPEYEHEIRLAFERLGECPEKQPYAKSWITELKNEGFRVLFLSNYFSYLMEKCPDVLDFIPLMDGGVFSCNEKLIKPDPEIYKLICNRYNLNPSECIFIDDNQKNVDSAEKFGIKSFLFENYEKNYSEIMSFLHCF